VKDNRTESEIRNFSTFKYRGNSRNEFFKTSYGESFTQSQQSNFNSVPYPDPHGYVIGF